MEFLWSLRTVRAWLMFWKVTNAWENRYVKAVLIWKLPFPGATWGLVHTVASPSPLNIKLIKYWIGSLCHLRMTSFSEKYSIQLTWLTQGKQQHLKENRVQNMILVSIIRASSECWGPATACSWHWHHGQLLFVSHLQHELWKQRAFIVVFVAPLSFWWRNGWPLCADNEGWEGQICGGINMKRSEVWRFKEL